MNGIDTFLNAYGLPAIAVVLLIKSVGVPIPIPADVLMFAAVARVANGTWTGANLCGAPDRHPHR